MTKKEAITLLSKHQSWRRGDETEMADPKLLGQAIDFILFMHRGLKADFSSLKAKWVPIDELFEYQDNFVILNLFLFSDGSISYGDEHPFATITHFMVNAPEKPTL